MARTTPKRLISWHKPSRDFVSSKCGRFNISPTYGGGTRPESYALHYLRPGPPGQKDSVQSVAGHCQTQREAKERAEEFYAEIPQSERDCAQGRWNWRQNTPLDQLVVIRMALEGHIDNHRDGCSGWVCERMDPLLKQLHDLEPYLRKGAW